MLMHSSSKAQAACVSDLSFLALASILMDREEAAGLQLSHLHTKKEEEEGQGAKGNLFSAVSLPGVKWNSSKGNLAVLSKVTGALSCEPRSNTCGSPATTSFTVIQCQVFRGGTSGKELACPCRRHRRCRFDF